MSNTRNFFQFYQRKPGQVYQDPLLRKGGTRAVEVGRASGAPSLCRGSRRPLSVTAQYVSVVTGLLTLVPPTPRYGRTPMPTYHRRTPIRRWVASSSLLRKPRARPGLRVSRGRPSNLQNGRSRPGRLGGRHSDGVCGPAPYGHERVGMRSVYRSGSRCAPGSAAGGLPSASRAVRLASPPAASSLDPLPSAPHRRECSHACAHTGTTSKLCAVDAWSVPDIVGRLQPFSPVPVEHH